MNDLQFRHRFLAEVSQGTRPASIGLTSPHLRE